MSISSFGRQITMIAVLLLASFLVLPRAHADTFRAGQISVSDPYSLATRKTADIAHVSLVIANAGEDGDVLISADVHPQIANYAGFDDLSLRVYRGANLRRSQPVFLKAGESRVLGFDTLHLVIFGIQGPLAPGMRFPIRLTFEKAGTLDVLVDVVDQALATSAAGRELPEVGLIKAQYSKMPARASASEPTTGSEFKCDDGSKLVLNFSKAGDGTDIVVWLKGASYRLPYQPPAPGPVQILWSDGENSLTWNPGVKLMWINSSAHLMCGRGHHEH